MKMSKTKSISKATHGHLGLNMLSQLRQTSSSNGGGGASDVAVANNTNQHYN